MKKTLNLAAIAFCGVAMLSLSSCLSGGNGGEEPKFKQITSVERTTMMNAIVGNYSGKLKFIKSLGDNKIDSADISWSVTADTMLVIEKFPVRAISGSVQAGEEMKRKLTAAEPAKVEMKLKLPGYMLESYFNQGYYLASPIAGKDIDVKVGDKDGKLTFTQSINLGSGNYQKISQLLEYLKDRQVTRLLIERITIDNQVYNVQAPFTLQGKKQ